MFKLGARMRDAAEFVRDRCSLSPRVGVILGSGLGGLASEIESPVTIDYADVPHFPNGSSVVGHAGELVCGTLAEAPIVAFRGRFHLYEGHGAETAALPVRLLQALGVETLIVCNAAGALNPRYAVGDLMLIDDQINFQFANPLVGVNDDSLGPRFPDMSAPYDRELQFRAAIVARRDNFVLHRGVYAAVLGPNYETRAEMRMLRSLGADVVGMSTVPEAIAARHAGMRVLGFSTVTNICSPDALTETDGHDVVKTAARGGRRLAQIIRGVIKHC